MKFDVGNPDHRRVLETARAWGVSPSRFMGREPEIVVQSYNGATVHVPQPEWTDDDREAAVALQDYEASLCSGCGRPLEETTQAHKEFAYKADLPVRCHYCTAAAIGQQDYADSPHSHALHFPVNERSEGL